MSAQSLKYFNIRPSEPVNGLVIITYHTQIPIFGCQKADQLKLSRIGILILIYHNISEPFLVVIQNLAVILK